MFDWFLPTLSEILAVSDSPETAVAHAPLNGHADPPVSHRRASKTALNRVRAEREWSGAIAALTMLLKQALVFPTDDQSPEIQGLVLSGPTPVLSNPELADYLSTWTFTADLLKKPDRGIFRLPPAGAEPQEAVPPAPPMLPLLPDDPLAAEQFCLVSTAHFSLVMVLGEDATGQPAFLFSFDPDTVKSAWKSLRQRVLLTMPHHLAELDQLAKRFAPLSPGYKTVMQFSRWLLENLPEHLEKEDNKRVAHSAPTDHFSHADGHANPFKFQAASGKQAGFRTSLDVELLQAIAHEVRTPLTTIRTLTRLLLKRKDLAADVKKRLEIIDRECSEQIDRFGLFFRAVELETSTAQSMGMPLTATSLAEMFQQSIPRWQQQASQRQLNLEVVLPQKMPTVVSDPTMLDQALTSLIERFTRSLPAGSHIQVEVMLAGDQLKLQLQSQTNADMECNVSQSPHQPILKSLGQLLTFQPETGSLSLNLAVTKNLFQALGAKLIVRQRPQHGEVMTVFLPLELNGMDTFSGTRIYEV